MSLINYKYELISPGIPLIYIGEKLPATFGIINEIQSHHKLFRTLWNFLKYLSVCIHVCMYRHFHINFHGILT